GPAHALRVDLVPPPKARPRERAGGGSEGDRPDPQFRTGLFRSRRDPRLPRPIRSGVRSDPARDAPEPARTAGFFFLPISCAGAVSPRALRGGREACPRGHRRSAPPFALPGPRRLLWPARPRGRSGGGARGNAAAPAEERRESLGVDQSLRRSRPPRALHRGPAQGGTARMTAETANAPFRLGPLVADLVAKRAGGHAGARIESQARTRRIEIAKIHSAANQCCAATVCKMLLQHYLPRADLAPEIRPHPECLRTAIGPLILRQLLNSR